jgi:hypothetical protein
MTDPADDADDARDPAILGAALRALRGLDLNREKIDLDCDCGATVTSTVGAIRRSPTLACPKCGATIQVDGSNLNRGVRNVDRAFGEMDGAIRRIGR